MITSTPTLMQIFSAADAGVPLGQPALELIGVPLEQIVPSRWQPRQQFDPTALLDLANDIAQHGVLTPPLVWRNEDLEYELIAGERRIRACYALALADYGAGMKSVADWVRQIAVQGFVVLRDQIGRLATTFPQKALTVQCREVWGKPAQLHELALVDNLQRADLSPLEEAHAISDLIGEYSYTQRDLATRLGKSQTWISQRLNLLNLAPAVAAQVISGDLDSATAREIARLAPAVQPAACDHLREFGLKSKAAANMIGRLLEIADPNTLTHAAPGVRVPPEGRLAQAILADLPDDAARQQAVLRYAAASSGKLAPPTQSHQYRDLLAAAGTVGPAGRREDVNVDVLWDAEAENLGYTCSSCMINSDRSAVQAISAVAVNHGDRNRVREAGWPKCNDLTHTCQAYTAATERLDLPTPYLGTDFAFTEAERPYVDGTRFMPSITSVSAWLSILSRYYTLTDEAAARRVDAKANGLVRALTEYAGAQAEIAVDFWSQRCEDCVFHKVGSADPSESCQYQANPPNWDNWDTLVARLWQSGNAPAIGRCRLYRLKQIELRLPNLPGSLELAPAGIIHLLSRVRQFQAGDAYGPAWLDVKRTNAWGLPTWSNCEPMLLQLLPDLQPGQRLALLLLAEDPFGWQSSVTASAYVPRLERAVPYQCIRDIKRE